jgi:NAD(P)-dependent dehydrogenase (short-subunit alcohol dehydrogenase family)
MHKVVFITGVSSGFGKSMSELLSQKGYRVYGISRREIEINQAVTFLKADVTDVGSVKTAIETVIKNEGRIDVLINNAGIGVSGPIEYSSADDIKLQMDTNFLGMVNVIQSALPIMRKQSLGTIVNFSSIGGIMGLPYQGFYSASKFAVEGMSEALRMELKPFNIKVVVIRPGDFFTGFTSSRIIERDLNIEGPYEKQLIKTMSIIEADEKGGLNPDYLAKKILKIIQCHNPKCHYTIASLEQKFATVLKILLPDSWFSAILGSHYGIK